MEPLGKRFWMTYAVMIALQLLYMTFTKTDVFPTHRASYYDALEAKKADALVEDETLTKDILKRRPKRSGEP